MRSLADSARPLCLCLVALALAAAPARAGEGPKSSWRGATGPHVTCVATGIATCAGEDRFQRPGETAALATARELSFGLRDGCALLADGRALCWGDDSEGQLGVAAPGGRAHARDAHGAAPAPVAGLPPLVDLDLGWLHGCGVDAAGRVLCWGADGLDQLGRAGEGPAPRPVEGLPGPARAVSAGGYHSCARMADGSVACWGDGSEGQLGQGAPADASAAVAVRDLPGPAAEVTAGAYHSCARLADGSVVCWGDNRFGQLGDGTRVRSAKPVRVLGLSGPAEEVQAGFSFTCARLAGGTVECWGSNELGELGVGGPEPPHGKTLPPPAPPRPVVGLAAPAIELSAAGNHACVALADGGVACWGSDEWGQLGDGGVETRFRPVAWRGVAATRPRPRIDLASAEGSSPRGLDVSYHSGRVDWRAAAARGDRFALTLATAGVDFADPYFFAHWEGMRQAGLVRGAYHFFVADDDPEAQAHHFLAHVTLEPGDLLPVVDIESRKQPVADLPARLRKFLDVIEAATGARPIIYTGPTFWRSNMSDAFGDYPLWIAEYGVDQPQVPMGWKKWHLWQWRGDVDLPEIAPIVDLNRLHPEIELRDLLIPEGAGTDPASARPVPVDHHVHLLGPGLLRDWKKIGARFSRADAAYLRADRLLDGAAETPPRAERVVLVPMAHLYGNSEFRRALGLSAEQEAELARAENDHVAREAARHPGRAVALC